MNQQETCVEIRESKNIIHTVTPCGIKVTLSQSGEMNVGKFIEVLLQQPSFWREVESCE